MSLTLWHGKDTRSLRALWTLEEMGLDYHLEMVPFPPRLLQPSYLEINPLGTLPYLIDGDTRMTESTGICHYLVDKYGPTELGLTVGHPEYGNYLNWLYHSDATLTFPQTLYLRYALMEPEERRQPQVAEDYVQWYMSRLRMLDTHLLDHDYLCASRFTIADIAVGYALYLGRTFGLVEAYKPQTEAYFQKLIARPAFQRANSMDLPPTSG